MTVVVRRQQSPVIRHSIMLHLSNIHQVTELLAIKSMMGRKRPNPGKTALKAVTIAIVNTFEMQGARNKGEVFKVCRRDVGMSMDRVVM